jgi:hypothetical protein
MDVTMSDPAPRPRGAPLYHPASIHFLDSNGVPWSVGERDARRDPGAPADWCLVFGCESAIRRVWIYPTFWRQLSPTDLEALSWMPGGRGVKPIKPY